MQVSTEKKEGLKYLLTVTVSKDEFAKAYADSFKKVSKKARIDGFRKGHIPANLLELRFGNDITFGAVDDMIDKTLFDAVKEAKLDEKMAGRPSVELKGAPSKDNGFTYTISLEVNPDIEVKPLADLKLKKIVSTVKDSDVDAMVETLRQQQGKWKTQDGLEFGPGTLARIDFTGRTDGKEFDGGKAKDFSLEFDRSQMIPGFTEQIKGHKAGDKFTIKVTFPEKYGAKDLAGKDAEFDISVNAVEQRELPEVNADFVKIYGIKDGDIAKFRDELRRNMERELKRAVEGRNEDQVCDALIAQYGEFDVPTALVQSMINSLKNRQLQNLRRYGLKELPKQMDKDELYHDDAVKQARLALILNAVAKASGEKFGSDETVDSLIADASSAFEDPEEYKKAVRGDKRTMQSIREQAYQVDLFHYIEGKASDGEAEKTFDQVVNGKE
jgi:trigger factor